MENQDLVTIGRQALLTDSELEPQFTGFMRRVDLYTESFTEPQILEYMQMYDPSTLPALQAKRVRIDDSLPLWGEMEDGSYEALAYLPDGAVVVYLSDYNGQYTRVSYHGLQGNVNADYLTEIG